MGLQLAQQGHQGVQFITPVLCKQRLDLLFMPSQDQGY
jgi:hypothetical protein